MPRYQGPVRIADASCEEDAMRVCRELHAENALFSMDDNKVRDILHKAFDRKGAIVGIIGPPTKIEAMICMFFSSFWYSNDPHIEELFVFVRPAYRRTKHAVHLIRFAKWAADEGKIPLVIGVISKERTVGKVKLYQRVFGKPIGNFFIYGLKNDGLEGSLNDQQHGNDA